MSRNGYRWAAAPLPTSKSCWVSSRARRLCSSTEISAVASLRVDRSGRLRVGNLCQAVASSVQPRKADSMPTRNINLTYEQDEFVESIVRAGEYQNASEAIRDAVRALQQRRREDALKLERLRLRIEAGIDDLDRGDFVEVDDEDLEAFFDTLRNPEKNRSG